MPYFPAGSFSNERWRSNANQFGIVGGVAAYTFDPLNKGADLDLSGGNLTATRSAGVDTGYIGVRGTDSQTSGKYYCEFTLNVDEASDDAVGIVNSLHDLSQQNDAGYLGTATAPNAGLSVGFWTYINPDIIYNDAGTQLVGLNPEAGDTICMAVDLDASPPIIKFRENGGSWSADYDITDLIAEDGTIFPALCLGNDGDSITANFGATAYAYTPPSGYLNWDGTGEVIGDSSIDFSDNTKSMYIFVLEEF